MAPETSCVLPTAPLGSVAVTNCSRAWYRAVLFAGVTAMRMAALAGEALVGALPAEDGADGAEEPPAPALVAGADGAPPCALGAGEPGARPAQAPTIRLRPASRTADRSGKKGLEGTIGPFLTARKYVVRRGATPEQRATDRAAHRNRPPPWGHL
jgi:hypothetical protein